MSDQKTVKTFSLLIEKVFSQQTEEIEDQIDFDDKYQRLHAREYNKIIEIISKIRDPDTLSDLMDNYLRLFGKYYTNKNSIHFHRSDITFKDLILQTTKTFVKNRDLFEVWTQILSGNSEIYDDRIFKIRFNELGRTPKSQIIVFIEQERKKRRETKSILNFLKDEFIKQKGIEVFNDPDQLYGFDPYPDKSFKSDFDSQISKIQNAWNITSGGPENFTGSTMEEYKQQKADDFKENTEKFENILDEFDKYLKRVSNNSVLQLFQIIKYLQDLIRPIKDPTAQGWTKVESRSPSELIYELYAMACVQLIVHANANKKLKANRNGFADDEMIYFFEPVKDYEYRSNIEVKLRISAQNSPASFEASKSFLKLILITKNQLPDVTLVNMKEILSTQSKWKQVKELIEDIRLAGKDPIAQSKVILKNLQAVQTFVEIATSKVDLTQEGAELSKAIITVGEWPGEWPGNYGNVRVVYIHPDNNNVYIEFASLKPHLFKVNKNYLKNKLYGTRIYQVYKNTVGMIYIAEIYLLMMGFFPAFIEGGFGALIVEIIYFVAGTKLQEIVSMYDTRLGKLLGFLLMTLGPRPNFKPGVNIPSSESQVNTFHVFEPVSPRRPLTEIIDSYKKSEQLVGEIHQSTTKGFNPFKSLAENLLPEEARVWVKEFVSSRSDVLVMRPEGPDAGLTLSVSLKSTGGKGSGLGSRSLSRPGVKVNLPRALQKELSKLEEYYVKLTPEDLPIMKKEVSNISQKFSRGIINKSQAIKEITNLLNSAKEVTGEYVSDFFVYSNFKVLKIYEIPTRKGGVPILDKVYKVQDHATGRIDLLWVEVKGGETTKLGYVTKKTYHPKTWKLISIDRNQLVRQGSGEWYQQKIIELYEAGHKKMAKELFQAAVTGNVQSAIVKSGIGMIPKFKFNSYDIIQWFRGKKMPNDLLTL